MARIDPVDPAEASDEVREALDRLPALNIFRTLAHAESTFRPFLRFGGAVLTQMSLDPVVRELAILTVAREAEAKYEWIQHVAIAKQVGATDEQIAALEAGDAGCSEGADSRGDAAGRALGDAAGAASSDPATGDASPFTPAQAAAVDLAACVVRGPRISPELWDCVREEFTDREIVELLIAIGDYLMLARLMTVLEIDLDEAPDGGVAPRSLKNA